MFNRAETVREARVRLTIPNLAASADPVVKPEARLYFFRQLYPKQHFESTQQSQRDPP